MARLLLGLRPWAILVLACGTAGAAGEKASTVDKPPPDPWVEHGLYPGGFETLGPWTAHRRTPLYRAPGSRKIVATVDACEEIIVDETELRGRPRELRVLKAQPPLFRKGERMWILAHDLEEGYRELWYRGKIRDDVEVSLEEALSSNEESCTSPSPRCWLWLAKEQPQDLLDPDAPEGRHARLEQTRRGELHRGAGEGPPLSVKRATAAASAGASVPRRDWCTLRADRSRSAARNQTMPT